MLPRLALSIRLKMLLVSSVLLAIPWIAYQYAAELERILRENQEQAVLNTARAIATALNDRPSLFQGPARDPATDETTSMFAHKLARPIELDGSLEDWLTQGVDLRALGREHVIEQAEGIEIEPITLWHALGVYDNDIYAAFEILDEDIVYRSREHPRVDIADHVRIGLQTPWGELRRYIVSAYQPGPVNAVQVAAEAATPVLGSVEPRIQGYWRETKSGFNLELRLPRSMVGPKLGFAFADVDDRETRRIRSIVGSIGPEGREALGTALVPPPEAVQIVRSLSRPGSRTWIVATDRRLVTRNGTLSQSVATKDYPEPHEQNFIARAEAFMRPLYRRIIAPAPKLASEPEPFAVLYQGSEAEAALGGKVVSARRNLKDTPIEVISSAHPVWTGERVIGAVIVEETTQGILSIRQQLIERLFSLALGAFIVVAIALFVFATRLVGRIRRLRDEAEQAIDSAGRLKAVTASSSARDELGDLSRSFSSALGRLAQYTQYLESLATRLSHELRTPIAVVRSSIDNLKLQSLPREADVYVGRAEQGLTRLATIITRMTEATRLEQMMRDTERERFDLRAVIGGCVEGYRAAYPHREFELRSPQDPILLLGVPDLIAQMLDKLIDNAVDFSRGDAPVEVILTTTAQDTTIAVRNSGPRLAREIKDQLFQSMASARTQVPSDEPHLGLGLYIVQLIVEFHQGKVIARDRADTEGVEVLVTLPRPAPEPT
jgi:dedicated sortase system histidine kinase